MTMSRAFDEMQEATDSLRKALQDDGVLDDVTRLVARAREMYGSGDSVKGAHLLQEPMELL
jgi:hypothetical protein